MLLLYIKRRFLMRVRMRTLLMGILGIFIFAVAFAPTSAMATLDEATKKEIDMYLDKKMAKKSFLPSGAGEMFSNSSRLKMKKTFLPDRRLIIRPTKKTRT
jgi:hypothetical protein